MNFLKPHKSKDHSWDIKSLNGQIMHIKRWKYYFRNGKAFKRRVPDYTWRDYKSNHCPREPLDSFYRPRVLRPTLTYKKQNLIPLHYAMRVSDNIGTHNYKRN